MTIEINGMAHVVLTVSDFRTARVFYGKLLPLFGMNPVFDGDRFFYCVGGGPPSASNPVRRSIGTNASCSSVSDCITSACGHARVKMLTDVQQR